MPLQQKHRWCVHCLTHFTVLYFELNSRGNNDWTSGPKLDVWFTHSSCSRLWVKCLARGQFQVLLPSAGDDSPVRAEDRQSPETNRHFRVLMRLSESSRSHSWPAVPCCCTVLFWYDCTVPRMHCFPPEPGRISEVNVNLRKQFNAIFNQILTRF